MEWLVITALAVGAYLLGSVPTAYLVVRLVKGVDIRKAGSGNVGALNTYHVLGFGPAMVVVLADTAKGVLAVGIPWLVGADYWVIFATTPSVVIGHNWPVFLGFRGGRGAAAILGISLIMVPLLTVVSLVPSLLPMWLLRNVVVGAALGFVMVNVPIATTGQPADQAALCYFLTFPGRGSLFHGPPQTGRNQEPSPLPLVVSRPWNRKGKGGEVWFGRPGC